MKIDEYLKNIEGDLTPESLKKIFGDNDIVLNGIPKDKFNTELQNSKTLKEQLEMANTSLEALKNDANASQELKSQIEKLKTDLNNKDIEFKKSLKLESIKSKLANLNVAYPELLISQIDLDKIENADTWDTKELREKFPNLFPVEDIQGANSSKNGINGPNATLEILKNQYNEAEKRGDTATMLAIIGKIKSLK